MKDELEQPRGLVVTDGVKLLEKLLRLGHALVTRVEQVDEARHGVDLARVPRGHVEEETILAAHLFEAFERVCQLIGPQGAARLVGRRLFVDQITELVDKHFLKLLIDLPLHLLSAALETEVQVFQRHDGVVLHHPVSHDAHGLAQVALFQLFDAFDGLPAAPRLLPLDFALFEQGVIVGPVHPVERLLLDDAPLHVDERQVEQVALAAVYADDVQIVGVVDILVDHLVDVLDLSTLEVERDGHMQLKMALRKALVLDQVVRKAAFFLRGVRPLVGNGPTGRVGRLLRLFLKTGFAIEHFAMTIQLERDVCKISRVEEHFPIDGMQVEPTLAMI